ncbi:hypothetical protein [Streptomyces sp. NPDC089919]|uniref:hypothetical protein n=1 Tax=Streptomyces sp. NPDC089919 TaxID=3155188 RepID=UPI0034202E76
MADPDFSAIGVRIERWPRALTRAGKVLIRDGRLELLTSGDREIDSAPLRAVRAVRTWPARRGGAVARINGRRYRLRLPATRFVEAVQRARAAPH